MTYSQIFAVLEAAELSPEKAARLLGVSGMTLRRWRSLPGHRPLPPLYARSFEVAIAEMIASGKLPAGHRAVQAVTARSRTASFQKIVKSLGFSSAVLRKAGGGSQSVLAGLAQIGSDSAKAEEVARSAAKVSSFGRMGAQWRSRIGTLTGAIRSPRLRLADKLVAYGALFYLIAVFDLVPDTIPGFGLLDDFAVLGLAAAYYLKRFPELTR